MALRYQDPGAPDEILADRPRIGKLLRLESGSALLPPLSNVTPQLSILPVRLKFLGSGHKPCSLPSHSFFHALSLQSFWLACLLLPFFLHCQHSKNSNSCLQLKKNGPLCLFTGTIPSWAMSLSLNDELCGQAFDLYHDWTELSSFLLARY